MRPSDRSSDLAKRVLPGELGTAKQFAAAYKSLPFSEVWDQLWRDLPGADIVVKFDKNPCSVHLVPSDGRFGLATDRVTHFSLAANDDSSRFGGMVLYGFTRQPVGSLVPLARSWVRPPEITALSGCKAADYRKESRDFPLVAEDETMSVRIAASDESPLVNPCFTVRNWGHHGAAQVKTTAAGVKDIRQGVVTDTDGTRTMVIWLDLASTSDVTVNISGAKPSAAYAPQSK